MNCFRSGGYWKFPLLKCISEVSSEKSNTSILLLIKSNAKKLLLINVSKKHQYSKTFMVLIGGFMSWNIGVSYPCRWNLCHLSLFIMKGNKIINNPKILYFFHLYIL